MTMRLTFYGGVEHVTGSHLTLETTKTKIAIDCGLTQGSGLCQPDNFLPLASQPASLDLVCVTHAHLDHIGRLPQLLKQGFKGPILSTPPTKDLAAELLLDSIHVITESCRSLGHKPLYNEKDLDQLFKHWQTIPYHLTHPQADLKITFFDAGHILGSAFIKIEKGNDSKNEKSIVFSGDLGNSPNPILFNTEDLSETANLVLESTYGDRNHEARDSRLEKLEKIIDDVVAGGGTLLIPAFAIERTQELITDIEHLCQNKQIPPLPIFLDSPLAIRVSHIYTRHPDYQKPNSHMRGQTLLTIPHLLPILNRPDEKKIFETAGPKIIIAGSGMLNGGRILGLLKKFISNSRTTLLFVGFQAPGTLGRQILDGQRLVNIEGQSVALACRVITLFSYSAHRDQAGLIDWVKPQQNKLTKIFLTHGDRESKLALRDKLQSELGLRTDIPTTNQQYQL